MNEVSSAGVGVGGSGYVVDHTTLATVADGLGRASRAFDEVGADRPAVGGTGLAEPLLLSILASASESAGRVAHEAHLLAAAVEDCNVTAETVDSQAAGDLLVRGGGPS